MNAFFDEKENLAELVSHMPEDDQKKFNNYGHFRVEAVFLNRVFIVYKPTGLTPGKAAQHKPPEILNLLKIVDFGVDIRNGAYAVLKDQKFEQELNIVHVPRKVFEYPVYMSVPPKLTLKWDARNVNGAVWRSMSFAVLIKTKNKSDFYSQGNTYIETPNVFRRLYPEVTGQFSF